MKTVLSPHVLYCIVYIMFNIVSIVLHSCNLVYQCFCQHSFLARALLSSHWQISYTNNIIISFSTMSTLHCHGILPKLSSEATGWFPMQTSLYQYHHCIEYMAVAWFPVSWSVSTLGNILLKPLAHFLHYKHHTTLWFLWKISLTKC